MSRANNPPSVDSLMRSAELSKYPERLRSRAAKSAIAYARTNGSMTLESLISTAVKFAELETAIVPLQAINASGVILHTGLGRARLAAEAVEAIANVANSHSVVEFDLETGQRGDRQSLVREQLCELTGAEDAMVVNNCAAALVLLLAATCRGKSVVISRGEMIEIGGAFRVPEIIRESGCKLSEVGCTNKTRLSDYSAAITEETGAILRCHPSNFRIVGFAESPPTSDLAEIAHKGGVILIDDVGSGCLVDTRPFGLLPEPKIQDSIASGADIVTFSGDKLLGATQAGIIIGKSHLISEVSRHPLARAMRVDKLTLAGLAATLKLYLHDQWREIPVWRSIARTMDQVDAIAKQIADAIGPSAGIEEGWTEIGGGSLAATGLPTRRIKVETKDPKAFAKSLRLGNPAVIGRIEHDQVWLDPRTVEPDEIERLVDSVRLALSEEGLLA